MSTRAIGTVAEATRQLGLSKEIRDDATEMVRRAEYALGKSIRQGQAQGTVRRLGAGSGPRADYERNGKTVRVAAHAVPDENCISPRDLFGNSSEWTETNAMADGAETPEAFEEALAEARAEGNLSRANVVRKVRGRCSRPPRDYLR